MIELITHYTKEYQIILTWFGIISGFMFIASIFLIPLFLKKMPSDYFINTKYHQIKITNFFELIIFVVKNIIGILLILAGVIMLFTPGQGIISIIIGLFLMQFRGKYKLERKIIKNNMTFKILNWIRQKSNKPPFIRDIV